MGLMRRDASSFFATVVVVGLLLSFTSLYVFSAAVGAQGLRWANFVGTPMGALACTGLCFVLWRSFTKGEVLRRVFLLLGIGLAMWTVAEFIYAYYDLTQAELPLPSLADVFWIPAYGPLFAALYIRFNSLRITPPFWQVALLALGVIASGALSLIFVIIPNAAASVGDPISIALSILYPVGDMLLVLGVGLVVMVLSGGELSRGWLVTALGFLMIAVSDSLFYYGIATGLYNSDLIPVNLVTATSDILYFGGYVVVAFGLFTQARVHRAM